MRTEKRYAVINDLQGGDFGMYRLYTIEQWREQAIEWADSDEHYGVVEELKTLKKEDIIDYISEFWELQFAEININRWTWDNKANELVLYNESNNKLKELFIIKNFTQQDYDKLSNNDTKCLEQIIERLNKDWQSCYWTSEENWAVKTTIYD